MIWVFLGCLVLKLAFCCCLDLFGMVFHVDLLRRASKQSRSLRAQPSSTNESLEALNFDVGRKLHAPSPLILEELRDTYAKLHADQKLLSY